MEQKRSRILDRASATEIAQVTELALNEPMTAGIKTSADADTESRTFQHLRAYISPTSRQGSLQDSIFG